MWKDYAAFEDICSDDFLDGIVNYHLPAVIYGMGAYAEGIAAALMRRGVKVDAFCVDAPFHKHGMQFCGYPVVSIEDATISWGRTHVFVFGMYGSIPLHIINEHRNRPNGIKYLEADLKWSPTHYVARWKYWDYFLHESGLKDVLLLQQKGNRYKKELFSRFVSIVNLELSTYCNRRCSYCPMSLFPRKQEFMSMDLLTQILAQLHEIHYDSWIMLNFFNEPLLDGQLARKIHLIREQLPYAWIVFNSNGDFLTPQLLGDLFKAGLNHIQITLHTDLGNKYEDADRQNAIKCFLEKMGLDEYFGRRTETKGKNIMLDIPFSSSRRLAVRCDNWQEYGNDRGGTLKEMKAPQRIRPCINPFREFFVAYDGTVKPCCNIYFGAKDVYGKVGKQPLWEIYFGYALSAFRRGLFAFSPKGNGCKTCNTEDNAREDTRGQREEILSELLEGHA